MKHSLRKKAMPRFFGKVLVATFVFLFGVARGEIKLDGDWSSHGIDNDSQPLVKSEGERLKDAADAASYRRDARGAQNGLHDSWRLASEYKLYFNDTKYYFRSALFMSKSRPDEVCTVASGPALKYQCAEGQRLTSDCHLMFFDAGFQEAGFNTVRVNEPYQFFCNSVVSVGVKTKGSDDLLVTVQYFPIDRKLASKASEIGSGWDRMTVLFHIKAVNGKIVAEQDDSCLGNPNRVDNIPDARKRLEKCSMASALKR